MRENFQRCLREVLKHEGGYSNHPKDPGGETNYGVTIRTARAHGYTGPMRLIPMATVEQIYRKGFWSAVGADDLPAGLDLAVFDFAVNSGPHRAKQFLARIKATETRQRVAQLCDNRLSWLKTLSTFRTFGRGWTNRVTSVKAESLKMVASPPALAPVPALAVTSVKPEDPADKPGGFWSGRNSIAG